MKKITHHIVHHLHEIAPGIVLEYENITLTIGIVLVVSLVIVFALQMKEGEIT